MKNILLIGGEGQLGMALRTLLLPKEYMGKYDITFPTHNDLDITNYHNVRSYIDNYPVKFDAIINCAAIHDANKCRENPMLAHQVNRADALVEIAWVRGIKYIYISTDMVYCDPFGSSHEVPIGHFTPVQPYPDAVYTNTKQQGEAVAWMFGGTVARVSTLFGHYPCRGKDKPNLIDRMISAAQAKGEFVASMDTVAITEADWAAKCLIDIVLGKYRSKNTVETNGMKRTVHHLVSSNTCTYTDIVWYIYQKLGVDPVGKITVIGGGNNSYPLLADDCRGKTWEKMIDSYLAKKGLI